MYSGNFLNSTDPLKRIERKRSQSFGNDTQYYHKFGAFTLEAQSLPDSIHHENFPSWELNPNTVYQWNTEYVFSTL